MQFSVLPPRTWPPPGDVESAYLVTDKWDDYTYKTQFYLIYYDREQAAHEIGQVKVGRFGMGEDRRPGLHEVFSHLPEEFFSVGQDASYYEKLNSLGSVGDQILVALRDIALDEELFARAILEDVTGTSLLRSVSRLTVERQFRRLANGGARLSDYHFSYTVSPPDPATTGPRLSFDVRPESVPPTNIHVLIGRNGVGKTRLLEFMTRSAVDEQADPAEVGYFSSSDAALNENPFSNLVSVSFSAFDSFEPVPSHRNRADGLQYTYVGLKAIRATGDDKAAPKSPRALAREFGMSIRVCVQGARLQRWRRALQMLESDPIFNDADVSSLAEYVRVNEDDFRVRARDLFRNLSSGHKIVLLTITKLVESVEEGSLVLLDEPEAHLHPPLLAAFIRALSDLLVNRNGVAIIATHSPVVLQEVPRECVWKLHRSGYAMSIERPEIETFGENVGTLTREVFGLEVTRSGFHRLLSEAVAEHYTFEDVLAQFDGKLGSEAEAIVRALAAAHRRRF